MTTSWRRGLANPAGAWPSPAFYGLTADARTQIAVCWEMAVELAQVDESLVGQPHRLHLLEALAKAIQALSDLELEVQDGRWMALGGGRAVRAALPISPSTPRGRAWRWTSQRFAASAWPRPTSSSTSSISPPLWGRDGTKPPG